MDPPNPPIAPNDHVAYMRLALALSQHAPAKPTNYRVGAVLVNASTNTILSSSYSLELPGNTHAEQNCLSKLARQHSLPESRVAEAFPDGASVVFYTTMEPCVRRLSGNQSCVERILATRGDTAKGGVAKVYVGVREPGVFVEGNNGRGVLEAAGVIVEDVVGLEGEIMEVTMAGHKKKEEEVESGS